MTDPDAAPAEGDSPSAEVPGWLRLDAGESVRWRARPRIVATAPWLLLGVGILVGGLVAGWLVTPPLAAVGTVGLGVTGWAIAANRRTWYVVTTDAVLVRSGVLGRRLRSVPHDRIQNCGYTQGVTGVVFGHGTVEVDVAGGPDLRLAEIHDPGEVLELVRSEMRAAGGDADSGSRSGEIPGDPEQWREVLGELRAVRRSLEPRE